MNRLQGSQLLLAAFVVFTGIHALLWEEKPTDYAQDHPSEAGCLVFRKRQFPAKEPIYDRILNT